MALTCWGAVDAHRCAGAAPVRVGRLGGEAQRAAAAPHVVHVVVGLVHGAGGEAGGDGSLAGQRAGHHTGGVHPLAQRHHLRGHKLCKTGRRRRKATDWQVPGPFGTRTRLLEALKNAARK